MTSASSQLVLQTLHSSDNFQQVITKTPLRVRHGRDKPCKQQMHISPALKGYFEQLVIIKTCLSWLFSTSAVLLKSQVHNIPAYTGTHSQMFAFLFEKINK